MLDYNQTQNLNPNSLPATAVPNMSPVTDNTVSVEQVATLKPKRKWWLYALLVLILVLLGSGAWWYYAKGQVMLLAKNMTWQSDGNYKMKQTIDLKLDNIKAGESSGFNFTNVDLKFDSFMDVIGQNLEGQADLNFSSNKENANFILKYKKIDKTVYLGIDSQDEWLKMIPLDLNSTWIGVDQESLQANPLLQGKPNDYMPSFKDWSQKNNVFLQNIKDKKLIILSDPHETKEVASVKLKKMDFDINPDKIDEFLLTSIDAFVDPSAAIEMKKNFETYKTKNQDAWANMKDLIKTTTFSFWVDPKSKNIVGMDFSLNNFDFKNKNEHFFNLTLNFSQTIEDIESKEIVSPENVMTLDELQTMLFSGLALGSEIPSIECEGMSSAECAQIQDDIDGDGLNNMDEFQYNTDPSIADTDGDGYLDGDEVKNGYNPLGAGKL